MLFDIFVWFCCDRPQSLFLYFCLACYGFYWIGFVSDFGLYRRQTSQQGTILVPGLVAPKPSRTRTSRHIFRPGHLVQLFGSPHLIFYNGVYFIMGGTSVVVPYCYLFLLSVFILWFSYYVSDIFCKF